MRGMILTVLFLEINETYFCPSIRVLQFRAVS